MNLQGKKVAVLGGTRISCQIVEIAQSEGMDVHVIDYNPPELSPAKLLVENHAQISVADSDAVAAYIAKHSIDGVITGYSDTILPMYADICEKAGLPCYGSRPLFTTFTDKRLWKKLCLEYGVPTARQYQEGVLSLPDDQIPYPLFVKPSDGSGSRGVAVARTREELARAIDEARAVAKNKEVVIEQYLDGPEVTVFWIFVDGEYYVCLLGDRIVKSFKEGVLPLPVGYTFPSPCAARYLEEIAPKCREMFKSQGVKNGMMFMQCVVQDGCAYVYDIGYRLTGSLENYLTSATAGFDAIQMLLHMAVTGRMTDDAQIAEKIAIALTAPCYNVSFLMAPGTIDHFEGVEELEKKPSIVKAVKAHVEGETLPPQAEGELRQISLRALGVVDTLADLEATMLDVQDSLRLIDIDGNDLLLRGLVSADFDGYRQAF